jgi:DNA-binding Xre family transcriptional regulator
MQYTIYTNSTKGQKMLTVEQIKAALADRKLTFVSDATGVNRNTLSQIRNGTQTNMQTDTLQKLSDYIEGKQ